MRLRLALILALLIPSCARDQSQVPPSTASADAGDASRLESCFFVEGTTQGRSELRACAIDADCSVRAVTLSCCGDVRKTGVKASSNAQIDACEARNSAKNIPGESCGCPPGTPTADDGSAITEYGKKVVVSCVEGVCATHTAVDCENLPPCREECSQFPMTGACSQNGGCRKAGSKLGEGCICDGAQWLCNENPEPVVDGCTDACE